MMAGHYREWSRPARLWSLLRDDRGSGSVITLAVIAVLMAVVGLVLAVSTALSEKGQLRADAESAALAAADTESGAVGGYPCENAARAAELGGSELTECTVEGVAAKVEVTRTIWGVSVTVRARAGPPPG
ncbi:flp pilus-assembly TadE/G-like family protein [Subtercola sp. PAMC28395]|uniref:Rv3654c family TadE-like protein n=1 Tax=Subtercola sp. PAMC28395 TaxID=2846775 RepID=UPI001C0D682E|nr:Rv3654c family TadE-like protein [Subtercola sp. PAMC28395]QWT24920.1 flp pilus-assembly TadE/G-like family protein [Subtercola sp. PAMC28395]